MDCIWLSVDGRSSCIRFERFGDSTCAWANVLLGMQVWAIEYAKMARVMACLECSGREPMEFGGRGGAAKSLWNKNEPIASGQRV